MKIIRKVIAIVKIVIIAKIVKIVAIAIVARKKTSRIKMKRIIRI